MPQGNPSLRPACTTSSAVWISQPIRTPHVASRPRRPGRTQLADVSDRGLAVREQRREDEQLSHRCGGARRSASSAVSRSRRASLVARIATQTRTTTKTTAYAAATYFSPLLTPGLPELAQALVDPLAEQLDAVHHVREQQDGDP